MMSPAITLLLMTVPSFHATPPAAPDDWPQWRGPHRTGVISDAGMWRDDLKGLRQTWRMELGPSYSGPIVTTDRVFVTATHEKKSEIVRALDRHTGKELWKVEWLGAMTVPFFARANGDWIRSTPAFDGRTLYVGGIRDVLVALDGATGRINWQIDFVERLGTPLPNFGFVCSPLVHGDHVFVQAAASFVKVDKNTGAVVWRTLEDSGGMMGSAFSSPIIATIHGQQQLIVQTRLALAGVDPADGKVLWSQDVPAFRGMNILTPTVYNNGVLTSTHRNKTFFYQVARGADGFTVNGAWTNKAKGYMSSPIIMGDYAYMHLGNGRLSCVDMRSGNTAWRSEGFGKYWSMVSDGRRILALDERGELVLVKVDPAEFMLLDRRAVSEQETWGHIAISGNDIFVRELEAIAAYEWGAPPSE